MMQTGSAEFTDRLGEFLAAAWPRSEHIRVTAMERIVGGWSKQMYAVDALVTHDGRAEPQALILRINAPDNSAILRNSRLPEHHLLNRLRELTSLPVPRSYMVDTSGRYFGAEALLMERLEGNPRISTLAPEEQASVAEHLVELMAELHLTPARELNPDGLLSDPNGWGIQVDDWNGYIESSCQAWRKRYSDISFDTLPIVYDTFLSLPKCKPRPLPLVIVHGELNPNNLITRNGRVSGLIDWERPHVGDPREDLAWFRYFEQAMTGTALVRSVRRDGGYLGYYNRLTGFDITEEELDYFTAFSHCDVSYGPYSSMRRGMKGEHAEITRSYFLAEPIGAQIALSRILRYPA